MKRSGAWSALACAAVATLATPGPARAEDAARARAEQLYRGGDRAFKVGQYRDAAEAFEQSYAALPLPDIAFAAAQAYRLQFAIEGDISLARRAVELYKLYVKAQGKGGRVPEAAEHIGSLEPMVARAGTSATSAPLRAARTLLLVSSPVDGATGTVGDQRGPLPLTAEVAPGEYVVTVEAPGYEPRSKKAIAVEGQLMPVELELDAKPATLAIKVEAGAALAVDGRPASLGPDGALTLPAGRHLLDVTRRGRVGVAYDLELARGEARDLVVDLQPTGQRKVVPWVLGGAGVLALASTGAALWAWSAQSDAQAIDTKRQTESITPAELDRYDALRGKRDDRALAAWILGGAAVGTAVTGALLYLLDTPAAGAPRVERGPTPLTPAVTTDGTSVALTVQGGF